MENKTLSVCPHCKNKIRSFYRGAHGSVCYICGWEDGVEKKEGIEKRVIGIKYEDVVLLEMYQDAATIYAKNLSSRKPAAVRAFKYMSGRGYSMEDIARFGIGYADYDDMLFDIFAKKYGDENVKRSGLFVQYNDGTMHDLFKNRIMIPITDERGRVIAFGGRALGDRKPKYLNSPETEIFSKRNNLFGLVPKEKRKGDTVLVCEGYMDCLAIKKNGFRDAVATLGTALTDEQIDILASRYKNVYLSFDSDAAGVAAAKRVIEKMTAKGMNVRVPSYTPYKDPDELLKSEGRKVFIEKLRQAKTTDKFLLSNATPEELAEHLVNQI